MKMKLAVLSLMALALSGAEPASVPYQWKSVQMVGGGFVDGIVFHPKEPGLRYARTDMGGAYRWDVKAARWQPLLDWVSYEDRNLMGVESIALDPNDPNRVYMALGTYTNAQTPDGAIVRSGDRGKTFERTNVPIKFGGNENGRGNGERMAVDPNDGRILFLGTRHNGLWKSEDRAVTWTKVTGFPVFQEPPPNYLRSGTVFVVFDPRTGSKGKASSTIYVGVSLMGESNLFRSTDAGVTWAPVPGHPTGYRPNHATLTPDGTLYISYGTDPGPWHMKDGGIWKLNTATGEWTDITPEKPGAGREFGYGALSVDARDPKVVIASTFHRPKDEEIYRTIDGGKTWKPVLAGASWDYSAAPYVHITPIHWMLDIEIDPFNRDHAMFTTGYGGWETFNLTNADSGKPLKWSVMSTGIEETVALELLSPPKGAHLLSAVGDYGGFVHWDLDKPAPEGSYDNPHFGNTNGLACAEKKPEIIVRVGRASSHKGGGNIGYTLDGGKTWQPAGLPEPKAMLGHIAVSPDGATWVWTPERKAVFYTADRGASWKQSTGIPANTRVIADRVNPKKFYGMDLFAGKLFISTDGAATFATQELVLPDGLPKRAAAGSNNESGRGDDRGGQDRIYATPGKEGDLWLAAFHGLYRSTNGGKTFTRKPGVTEMHAFGFGKDALYMVGVVNGTRGIFRADTEAKTWVRINDGQHQWGMILHITGDPKLYGRVYVGTHGRGTVYGDPR